jgi:hypothetical protein
MYYSYILGYNQQVLKIINNNKKFLDEIDFTIFININKKIFIYGTLIKDEKFLEIYNPIDLIGVKQITCGSGNYKKILKKSIKS